VFFENLYYLNITLFSTKEYLYRTTEIHIMSEPIFEKIATILSTKKGIDKELIFIESSFEDLGLDSLDAVELISDLEDEFNVTIPNIELQNIKTIQQAVDGLQKAIGS